MKSTDVFKVNGPWRGELSISARPRGADWLPDELQAWRAAGIDMIVSLLTPAETADLELDSEAPESMRQGLEFISFPIEDRSVPHSISEVFGLVGRLSEALGRGRRVNVHCRQGIGRAPLIAVALLVDKGLDPKRAVDLVSSGRGVPIPETPEQRLWIDQFAAAIQQPQR